jgi:hypothetical protein
MELIGYKGINHIEGVGIFIIYGCTKFRISNCSLITDIAPKADNTRIICRLSFRKLELKNIRKKRWHIMNTGVKLSRNQTEVFTHFTSTNIANQYPLNSKLGGSKETMAYNEHGGKVISEPDGGIHPFYLHEHSNQYPLNSKLRGSKSHYETQPLL